MLYNTVEIRKSAIRKTWGVNNKELSYEREDAVPKPSGILGFWHYPRELGEEQAFETLKQAMIDARNDVIISMQKEISELQALQYKPNKRKKHNV